MATIISVGSLFYSAILGVNAEFDELLLKSRGDRLVLSTQLTNCFSDDLDRIFSSGKEVKINFIVQVLDKVKDKLAQETAFYHSIRFSLIEKVYTVHLSEIEEDRYGLTLEEAKNLIVEIEEYFVISENLLQDRGLYEVKITASMGKIFLPGMDEKTNLMFYWNSLKPTVSSDSFTINIFRE